MVLADLRTQQDALKELLESSFLDATDLDPDDGFTRKMVPFCKEAEERLSSLKDLVVVANNTYVEALKFYGEDKKTIAGTDEFFRIFKTFVDSYKVSYAHQRIGMNADLPVTLSTLEPSIRPQLTPKPVRRCLP